MTDKIYKCCYCGSPEGKFLFSASDMYDKKHTFIKCNQCHATYLYPLPDNLIMYYDEAYFSLGKTKFTSYIERYIDFFRKRKACRIAIDIPDGGSILDIGCGNGNFLNYISKHGKFKLFGTEIDGGSAKRALAQQNISLFIGNLKDAQFAPKSMDVISLFHVFEHLSNPYESLSIIADIIKDNGKLIVSMPDIGSWQAMIFKGKWFHIDPPRHVIFYKRNDLKKIMSTYGFECIREKSLSWEQNPYGWIQSILNVFCRKREVLYEYLKKNKIYTYEYSNTNILFQKLFFIVFVPFFAFTDIIESLFRKSATFEMTFKKTIK